ncbi:EamA family transporter [Pelosinus propionicus]|uniref:EamA family transporter n=1 Tax=Pelosinus propionicus TaxID=380084 RepID=UPI001587F66B|nr:EamA family transporter [Pelosinus propionicus]
MIIISNLFYHNATKKIPEDANVCLSLAVTYAVSLVGVLCTYIIAGNNLAKDIHNINWTSFVLGISLIGVEFGYVLMYRFGWKINTGSLLANVCVSLFLILIGGFLYKEIINVKQIVGIVFCLIGIFLVSR